MSLEFATRQSAVSVLVPARDEEAVIDAFLAACDRFCVSTEVWYEIIVIDDGSRDNTWEKLQTARARYGFLRTVRLPVGQGIAAALAAGAAVARAPVCVFYPADLQYDPMDIPRLANPVLRGECDVMVGVRDGAYDRAFVSRVYNTLCGVLFGVTAGDLNGVKAFRRDLLMQLPVRRDWHRYLVVFAGAAGAKVLSRPIPLYPRAAGVSKFSWRRIPGSVLDLFAVWFRLRGATQPMRFFGGPGFVLGMLGCGTGALAVWLRMAFRADVALLVALTQVLVLGGLLLVAMGFLGEMLTESRDQPNDCPFC